MKLSNYLNAMRGNQAMLCADIGAHSPDMSRWATGARPIPAERCPSIERFTGGEVTCEEMRPDVRWHRIRDKTWPNPGGRPLIDVAVVAQA